MLCQLINNYTAWLIIIGHGSATDKEEILIRPRFPDCPAGTYPDSSRRVICTHYVRAFRNCYSATISTARFAVFKQYALLVKFITRSSFSSVLPFRIPRWPGTTDYSCSNEREEPSEWPALRSLILKGLHLPSSVFVFPSRLATGSRRTLLSGVIKCRERALLRLY